MFKKIFFILSISAAGFALSAGTATAQSSMRNAPLAAFNNALIPLAMLFSLFIFGEIEAVSAQALLRLAFGGSLIAGAVIVATRKKIS